MHSPSEIYSIGHHLTSQNVRKSYKILKKIGQFPYHTQHKLIIGVRPNRGLEILRKKKQSVMYRENFALI